MSHKQSRTQSGTENDWVEISLMDYSGVGLKNDGSLWSWGNNGVGQLGINSNVNSTSPLKVGTSTNWFSIASGNQHVAAIDNNNSIWLWGNNYYGQIGANINTVQSFPGIVNCNLTNIYESDEVQSSITVFPNPSHNEFHVQFKNANSKIVEIRVINNEGMIVQKSLGNFSDSALINLSDSPKGMYHVLFISDKGIVQVFKIIKT